MHINYHYEKSTVKCNAKSPYIFFLFPFAFFLLWNYKCKKAKPLT
jgi:hypothetical protein